MPYREKFSDSEWDTLSKAPLLVFLSVASADGKIDKKEKKAFQTALSGNKNLRSQISNEVLTTAAQKYADIDQMPDYSMSQIALELKSVNDIAKEKLSSDEALEFKKVMIALGVHIGNSSGGFFGSNFSDEEVQALKNVGNYLNVSVAQLQQSPSIQDIVTSLG